MNKIYQCVYIYLNLFKAKFIQICLILILYWYLSLTSSGTWSWLRSILWIKLILIMICKIQSIQNTKLNQTIFYNVESLNNLNLFRSISLSFKFAHIVSSLYLSVYLRIDIFTSASSYLSFYFILFMTESADWYLSTSIPIYQSHFVHIWVSFFSYLSISVCWYLSFYLSHSVNIYLFQSNPLSLFTSIFLSLILNFTFCVLLLNKGTVQNPSFHISFSDLWHLVSY